MGKPYTPFAVGVLTHFIKEKKQPPPKTSWWADTKSREEFSAAAHARDDAMGWSHGAQGRELKTLYDDWRNCR